MSGESGEIISHASNGDGQYFLRDDTADISEGDDFGHYQYVQTITDTIKEVDPPWQIALYGRWGTGKSSILEAVEDALLADSAESSEEVEFVSFDAWKHAEDSIRTEFLLTLDRELGEGAGTVVGQETIKEELMDVSVTEEVVESEMTESDGYLNSTKKLLIRQLFDLWHQLKNNIIVMVVIVLTVFLHFLHARGAIPISIPNIIADTLLITVVGGTLASELFRGIGQTETYQRMENPRRGWSGAYESLFERILNTHSDRNSESYRYVIAIDNLDRCEPGAVYDVLISMKTFFEGDEQDCIYLIPCDADRLRAHVSEANIAETDDEVLDEAISDENEFLRKFFQTTIKLPPLQIPNIRSFAEDQFGNLYEERQPDEREGVIDVMVHINHPTPRRVKHLINRFISYRKLAEELETAGLLKFNTVTTNEPFLMKVLVLQEDYPEVYDQLRENPQRYTELEAIATEEEDSLLQDNETDVRFTSDGGTVLEQQENESPSSDNSSETTGSAEIDHWDPHSVLRDNPNLISFLQGTSNYNDDPEPFVYLGDANFAEAFGRYEDLREPLNRGDLEAAKEKLDESVSPAPHHDLEQFIDDIAKRELDDPDSELTSIKTTFALIASLDDDSSRAGSIRRGLAHSLNEIITLDRVEELPPAGVWPTVMEAIQDGETTEARDLVNMVIDFTITEGLEDPNSPQSAFFKQIVSTIENNGELEEDHYQRLRQRIDSLLEDEDSDEAIPREIASDLQGHDTAIKILMTNTLYRELLNVVPASSSAGVDESVFETLLSADAQLKDAPAVEEELSTLTADFMEAVFDACVGDLDKTVVEPIARLREASISRLTGKERAPWKIHSYFASLVHRSEEGLSTDIAQLLGLWLDFIDEGVVEYGTPDLRPAATTPDWIKFYSVESTFTDLFKKGTDNQRVRLSEEIADRRLDVVNKDPILEAYLENVPDLVTEEDIVDVLQLADTGELAPLERHLTRVIDGQTGSLARWASIMTELPEKAGEIREDLIDACLTAVSTTNKPDSALVAYPAVQFSEFKDQPALRDRFIEVVEKGFATGQVAAQTASAAALSRMEDSVEIKEQFVKQAIKTVWREYERGAHPAPALDEFVGEWLGKYPDSAEGIELDPEPTLEGLMVARADFVGRETPDTEDRRDVFNLLLDQYEMYKNRIEGTVIRELLETINEQYHVDADNPFTEECERANELVE